MQFFWQRYSDSQTALKLLQINFKVSITFSKLMTFIFEMKPFVFCLRFHKSPCCFACTIHSHTAVCVCSATLLVFVWRPERWSPQRSALALSQARQQQLSQSLHNTKHCTYFLFCFLSFRMGQFTFKLSFSAWNNFRDTYFVPCREVNKFKRFKKAKLAKSFHPDWDGSDFLFKSFRSSKIPTNYIEINLHPTIMWNTQNS